jgi:alpha-beta hydrolase superfamily lysophospholipase
VPAWKEAVASLASHLPPWIAFPASLDPAGLSHDPAVVAAYRDDPKVFDDLSAAWYVAVDAAQEAVRARAGEVRLPLLMLVGGADPVADPEASRRFFAAAASEEKRLVVYDGMLHEVLNETERRRVRGDLLAWLEGAVPRPAG